MIKMILFVLLYLTITPVLCFSKECTIDGNVEIDPKYQLILTPDGLYSHCDREEICDGHKYKRNEIISNTKLNKFKRFIDDGEVLTADKANIICDNYYKTNRLK